MRRAIVYLTLAALLAFAIGAGYVASGWPGYCRRAHWCGPAFPR